tara:strand:- start:133 stop:306 length:174 start_codon:yes stop_codon:yes gene_type:complete
MDEKISAVLSHLSQVLACHNCGARLRFGDVECPHCGTDIDLILINWAKELIEALEKK